jgi:nitronate monooxygenase
MDLRALPVPIVQAPLSGGASTPELAAAVADAGGFGFLAFGYKTADAAAESVERLRELSAAPFGVNIFAPPAPVGTVDRAAVSEYAARLRPDADRYKTTVGDPRHDDDRFDAKLALVTNDQLGVAVVSFTFGLPEPAVIDCLKEAGSDVWITVTSPDEALQAAAAGADALVVQGFEAGGHRGGFTDPSDTEPFGLLALLRLIAARVQLPLVAAGGIADGASIAAVLAAGAAAAQIGTALMRSLEAGTSAPHRIALAKPGATGLTRAFSGRQARAIVNRFMREHGPDAPVAYPDVHHLTTPIRVAAREAGDPEAINLWAGQTHELALEAPAAEIVRRLAVDARAHAAAAAGRLAGPQR